MCLGSEDRMCNLNLGITSVDCFHMTEMLQLNHAVPLSHSHFPLGVCHEVKWHSPKMPTLLDPQSLCPCLGLKPGKWDLSPKGSWVLHFLFSETTYPYWRLSWTFWMCCITRGRNFTKPLPSDRRRSAHVGMLYTAFPNRLRSTLLRHRDCSNMVKDNPRAGYFKQPQKNTAWTKLSICKKGPAASKSFTHT